MGKKKNKNNNKKKNKKEKIKTILKNFFLISFKYNVCKNKFTLTKYRH